jgi:hypothetical protein
MKINHRSCLIKIEKDACKGLQTREYARLFTCLQAIVELKNDKIKRVTARTKSI